jgi:hypothetical protein
MAKPAAQYTISVTAADQKLIEELEEGSPFTQAILLRVALRVGLSAIRKDPTVLMPFLNKQSGD